MIRKLVIYIVSFCIFLFFIIISGQIFAINIPGISELGSISFGGKINKIERCDAICSGFQGKYMEVGSPKGGGFITTFGTKIYQEKSLKRGSLVTGLAKNNEKTCKRANIAKSIIQRRLVCDNKGSGKEIKIIGTSK